MKSAKYLSVNTKYHIMEIVIIFGVCRKSKISVLIFYSYTFMISLNVLHPNRCKLVITVDEKRCKTIDNVKMF